MEGATSYSDYDSEDYSSGADEDYVPAEEELSEDDMSECVREDAAGEEGQGHAEDMRKRRRKGGKGLAVRKRKRGGLQPEGEEDGGVPVEEPGGEKQSGTGERKKADDLWASFLSEVGPRPKPAGAAQSQQAVGGDENQSSKTDAAPREVKNKEPSKVTITKVFDFAGEEVRVTKEVDADSREARSFLKKKEEEEKEQQKGPTKPVVPTLTPGPSAKRPAGVSSVLSRIGGKKQKMSTLEKSRLDWDSFKTEEGIGDELAIHNRGKEGYVERKAFLERVDQRQFELEKSLRLGNMKR
ncbi:craniofacial development protein 1 isoform X1 [Lepisosteus oculatus]|uniref:craniofacial development protein 1 isoform X1 n=1 Tax=Lepisosteus oculatus TaxID=7918 RepID=UPI0035F53005